MGPPGSGKGTQASYIAGLVGVHHVASGDLFRDNLAGETELGLMAKKFMDSGDYVPDDITVKMVLSWINEPEHSEGFVLDGFPRTVVQAKALGHHLGPSDEIDNVIFFDVSEEILVERLSGRLLCTECHTPFHMLSYPPKEEGLCDLCGSDLYQRSDDNPEVVKNRLQTYKQETEPLIKYFSDLGNLHEIDAARPVVEVRQSVKRLLGR